MGNMNLAAGRAFELDSTVARGARPITAGGRALSNHPRGTTVTPKSKVRAGAIASIKMAEARRRAAYNAGRKSAK